MNITKCSQGHYYDRDKYDKCPQCQFWDLEGTNETVVLPQSADPMNADRRYASGAMSFDSSEGTVSLYSSRSSKKVDSYKTPVEPVVGWLVCVKGNSYGLSFPLRTGRNYIGRDRSNDVSLPGDISISRQCHATLVYDPRGKSFLLMPGTSKELFYLNDKVVLNVEELKSYDRINLGHTDLIFVPFCGDKFNWEEQEGDKES